MSDRHPLVVKLKSGEYDGVDLMQAWLLIERQQKELAQLRKAAQAEVDRQRHRCEILRRQLPLPPTAAALEALLQEPPEEEDDKPDPNFVCFYCGEDSCDCDML